METNKLTADTAQSTADTAADRNTTTGPAPSDDPRTREALDKAQNGFKLYGALGATALLALVAVAGSGHPVNTFMWVRAALLPLIAVLLHRMTVSASRGSRRAFERVSSAAVVMPIAIVGVDLIPGVCPLWYAVAQTVCMLPVVRIAFLTRSSALRAAFPKTR
ncbi:hypothetical protein OHU11_21070 [Streptomyces sp. NBC_00257]|uniref:hypothetical protein n=1 Tax=Streptomyces TaxID=1883 RepID=UPI0021A3C5B8|nr:MULTISPECIES: hypothetical protein [Streptomyces]MCT2545630.1 hypothetical protein [Streptomyces atratus]MCX5430168.1 hypothetical protein [Streptomyces sp. NBC_00062]